MQIAYRSIVLVVLAVALTSATPLLAQSGKVAVFDPQRVSEETVDGKSLQAQLKALGDQKQAEITAMEAEIKDMRQRLEQQSLSLSIDKRTKLEVDIQRKMLQLNAAQEMANAELQIEIQAVEAVFNEKLRAVIDEFGRSQSFDLILQSGAVAWAATGIDVTTAIIDQYNQMFPAIEE